MKFSAVLVAAVLGVVLAVSCAPYVTSQLASFSAPLNHDAQFYGNDGLPHGKSGPDAQFYGNDGAKAGLPSVRFVNAFGTPAFFQNVPNPQIGYCQVYPDAEDPVVVHGGQIGPTVNPKRIPNGCSSTEFAATNFPQGGHVPMCELVIDADGSLVLYQGFSTLCMASEENGVLTLTYMLRAPVNTTKWRSH